MTRRLTLLFAIAGGAAVGNLYWAQPLLDFIARDLQDGHGAAGWLVTATQLGYAIGVLLFVPLGDVLSRRILVPDRPALRRRGALLASALAPTFPVLLVTLALVGLTTVSGQILVPLAGDLADDQDRGSDRRHGRLRDPDRHPAVPHRQRARSPGRPAGGRSTCRRGRGWRSCWRSWCSSRCRACRPRTRLTYPALIGSVFAIVRRERVVRWSLVLGGTSFAVFTMFWTSLTFLLSAPPFSFSVTLIGLFGLVGLAGAVAAQRAGRLQRPRARAAGDRRRVGAGARRVRRSPASAQRSVS